MNIMRKSSLNGISTSAAAQVITVKLFMPANLS